MLLPVALLPLLLPSTQETQAEPPNIVLIVADDLGYGDLGCYGQEVLKTPNIDRLAEHGRRYTQFYAGSTVCAPSRSVLMTGQHSGHTFIRGNARENLRPEDVTMAEVLGQADYAAGCFGKWGIGHEGSPGMPTRQGFQRFFGYLHQAHAHNYYPTFLIRDEERVPLENVVPKMGKDGQGVASEKRQYSHDLIVDEALDFIESAEQPFFLYLPWTLPHANNEAGKKGMEVPDLGAFAQRDWPEAERGFAAMLQILDRDVGRVMSALDRAGVARNTLVMFTSDNGPHNEGGHKAAFFHSSGELRGTKRSLHEGGIRVPLIAHWPGRVPAGSTSDHISAFWDLLPTLAEVAGASIRVPEGLDGISFAPDLLAGAGQREHDYLYWAFFERGSARALRRGKWKLIQQPFDSPPRLYDLEADPGEERDVAGSFSSVAAEMRSDMAGAYEPSERWKFPQAKQK